LPFITPGAKLLDTVRLDIAASAQHRDLMLGELNAIGSEDEATKWAHRRLAEKNKLNAADANLPCKNRGPSKRLRRNMAPEQASDVQRPAPRAGDRRIPRLKITWL
jgi:hypothetical protein